VIKLVTCQGIGLCIKMTPHTLARKIEIYLVGVIGFRMARDVTDVVLRSIVGFTFRITTTGARPYYWSGGYLHWSLRPCQNSNQRCQT
jgi:hypothetical protein